MKKNGFISTSLIYTFFILFLLLLIFLLNSYSSTRFYISQYKYDIKNNFAEASIADINLYFMVWDPTTQEYEINDAIPSFGYVYESGYSYCRHGSTISYVDGNVSVAASRRDECYAYFKEAEQDIILKIYTKESEDSSRVLVKKVPGYNYGYTGYTCTNDATIEFNEETRKIKISAKEKATCEIEFVKKDVDVVINIYREDALGEHEYDGLKYKKVNEIPGVGYEFKEAVCKGDTVVTAVDGSSELSISTYGSDECDVYYTGGNNKVELIYMMESDEGVSGYTTGKKYTRTARIPTTNYKYVGFICDDPSASVTVNNGTFIAESDNQTVCRAYFNYYSGDVYIHYYLETSNDNYESVSYVPSLGYKYNSAKSKCNNGSIINVENNIVSVDSTEEDECYVYYDMTIEDIEVLVYVMNRETNLYELSRVPIAGYTIDNRGCTNGATIEYINSSLVVNTEGPTVCTVYFY